MSVCARRSLSTNVTRVAPRLSASMPTAPVPAKPSSTVAPAIRGARMLNSVSRSLSDVGRSPSHVGAFSRRPFNEPAITRIRFARLKGSRSYGPAPPAPHASSNLDELEALFPARQELVHARGVGQRLRKPARGLLLRRVQHLAIADEIDHPERRQAGLARAEEIAGAAQPEIALRDLEAVGRVGHRLQPLARLVGERVLVQQETERLMAIAADAPAQLMQLRQAEALGVLDNHHARVRHIHPDLDDRRRYQNVQLAGQERLHDAILRV